MSRRWGLSAIPPDSLGGIKLIGDFGSGAHRTENHLYFYSEVTPEAVQELMSHLREAVVEMRQFGVEFDIDPPPLHIHIKSDGGDLFAGLAVLDTILETRKVIPIHTHIEGSVASAATLMSIAGSHRTIGTHSFILIHQLSSGFWGKFEEWKDQMKNNEMLMKTVVDVYAEHANMGVQQVRQVLKKDLWFDAKQALQLGLVDEII